MKRAPLAIIVGLFAPAVLFGGCSKCNPDKAPPPLPTETVQPEPPETSLEAEDAGEDVEDASDADADGPVVVYKKPSDMKACCQALSQNANSTPPPGNVLLQQAASACLTAVAQNKDKSTIVGIAAGALKAAGLAVPSVCR